MSDKFDDRFVMGGHDDLGFTLRWLCLRHDGARTEWIEASKVFPTRKEASAFADAQAEDSNRCFSLHSRMPA